MTISLHQNQLALLIDAIHQSKSMSDFPKAKHIGIWGLTSTDTLVNLFQVQTQQKQRIHVSLFLHSDMAQTQEQLTLLQLALEKINTKIALAPIDGCQRLHINSSFIVDAYIGNSKTMVTELDNWPIRVDTWLVDAWDVDCWKVDSHLHNDEIPYQNNDFSLQVLWQLGRLSQEDAAFYFTELDHLAQIPTAIVNHLNHCGFKVKLLSQFGCNDKIKPNDQCDAIASDERQALRNSIKVSQDYDVNDKGVAIIGGGIASACLALSLAERGRDVTIYCEDNELATAASGNRQGAIYPLLTPENDQLSQFFQLAFLYSRQRALQLTHYHCNVSYDFCGVLHTGYDDKTTARLNKIIDGQNWPKEIAYKVNQTQASQLANVSINKAGFFYPLGGWICPSEFAKACIERAKQLAKITLIFNASIKEIIQEDEHWLLQQTDTQTWHKHSQLVLANGAGITQFEQTKAIPLSGFRGQVSHVPKQGELGKLTTVICANGYLTPAHQDIHCVGASYVKNPTHLEFCPIEQQQNGEKMQQSFPDSQWPKDIDVSLNDARVGVRMVCRDHFPMMGAAPNTEKLFAKYEQLLSENKANNAIQAYWQHAKAPTYKNLYLLGGFGSRGLSSAPLVAECLAANLCGDIAPLSTSMQALLNPNRMWMRKLVKGKALY